MIILMTRQYNCIHVGSAVHFNVREDTWQCYLMLFRWLFETSQGTPIMFQGGWSVEVK